MSEAKGPKPNGVQISHAIALLKERGDYAIFMLRTRVALWALCEHHHCAWRLMQINVHGSEASEIVRTREVKELRRAGYVYGYCKCAPTWDCRLELLGEEP